MDTTQFTYFVSLYPNRSGFSIKGQFTDQEGNEWEIPQGVDKQGNKNYRRFRWTQQNRTIRIPNKQQNVIEFLRNHPMCEGSPNNPAGHGAAFKELNDKKAADVALQAKKIRSKAESIALSLSEEEITEFSILIGSGHSEPSLQAHAVAEYAGNNPEHFLEMYEDEARAARVLFNRAKNAGLIKNKGFMVFWENIHLGNGDENAIQKIFEDKQLAEALTQQLKKEGAY